MNATRTPFTMKLEVVMLGVSDVDRAKAFYEKLGWRLDADFASGDDWRVVQMTPHNSPASIIFGKGIAAPKPGSTVNLMLAVDDVEKARADLNARGVQVGEVFHYAAGLFAPGDKARIAGRDPQGRSYYSFASFEDPDGNGWLLQEIQSRAPGREWQTQESVVRGSPDPAPASPVVRGSPDPAPSSLADLFREAADRHHHYEQTHAEHHWADWYAPYVLMRENGGTVDEAVEAAGRYMEAKGVRGR